MESCAWMSGPYQRVGPPLQSSGAAAQLPYETMRNLQTGTIKATYHYRPLNSGDGQPQAKHTEITNLQRVGPQRKSSERAAAGMTNSNYWNGNHHSVDPRLQVNNGFQAATMQDLHQSSPQNPLNQSASNKRTTNLQHGALWTHSLQNVNGVSTQAHSAYTTTATSFPQQQVVHSNTGVFPTAHNLHHRHNSIQHGFPPSVSQTDYNSAVSQSIRYKRITTNNSGSQARLAFSRVSHPAQQDPSQLGYSRPNENSLLLSRTNDFSVRSSADSEEQIIARIADSLQKSCTADLASQSSVYTGSPYRGRQFISNSRMMQVSHNVHPADICNTYAPQSSAHSPGQTSAKINNSPVPRTQQSVAAPTHHSSVPNGFFGTGDGGGNGGKAANANFPTNNGASDRNHVGTLSDACQSRTVPENISPQLSKYFVGKNRELLKVLGVLPSVKANDGSVHLSSGRTGTRAVAVVQPLEQDGKNDSSSNMINNSAECTTTDESVSYLQKMVSELAGINRKSPGSTEGSNRVQENPTQILSDKSEISDLSASGTFVSSSDSAGQRGSQKQSCEDDTGSEQAMNTQGDPCVSPTAQTTSEEAVSQSEVDTSDDVVELSSTETIPCTIVVLERYLLKLEKNYKNLIKDSPNVFSFGKLVKMFWDNDIKQVTSHINSGWYNKLIQEIKDFHSKHVTQDTVILSNVKKGHLKNLCGHRVLKHDEVYAEPPYKSSWLNVSEQLDDIDKEFGFPWPLRHRPPTLDGDVLFDDAEIIHYISAELLGEEPNQASPETEPEPVDEEQPASPVEAASTQTASHRRESTGSSEPFHSFEIQVLPQKEAKHMFEQFSTDTETQTESAMNGSVETERVEDLHVLLNHSKLENKLVSPVEQLCCSERLTHILQGSSASQCQCQNKQSPKGSPDKDRMTEVKEDGLCVIESDGGSISVMEGGSPEKGWESTDKLIVTHITTVDHPEDEEANSVSHLMSSSQSSVILRSGNEDLSSRESEIPDQMTDLEKDSEQAQVKLTEMIQPTESRDVPEIQPHCKVDCEQDPFEHTGRTLACSLVRRDEGGYLSSSESEGNSQRSDLEESCGQAQLTSADVGESSPRTTEEPAHASATAALQTTSDLSQSQESVVRKRKRVQDHDRQKSKKSSVDVERDRLPVSKCRKGLVDVANGKPSASSFRTVKLALFGSAQNDICDLAVGKKIHYAPPGLSNPTQRPPKVLSVRLSPLKRKSSDAAPTEETSLKQRIHEEWRKSFLPTEIRRISKSKTQKSNFPSSHGPSLKKAERPGSLEKRCWSGNTKVMRETLLSKGLKHSEETRKRQPADQETGDPVRPMHENNVLRFSMLPKNSSFMDGLHRTKNTRDAAPNEPGHAAGKSSNKTVTREKGVWSPDSERKYCPLRPKTSGLFQKFQKKYKEMTQQQ